MQRNTRFLTGKTPDTYSSGNELTYNPGIEVVRYYVTYLKNFPRLKSHIYPITELANRVRTKIRDQTDDLNKLYRQIGALWQYFKIFLKEVQIWPNVYPIDIGDVNRDRGTLGSLSRSIKDLKDIKETGNKKKLNSGFEKLEREFGPSIEEIETHIRSCEKVSIKKIIAHGEFPEELTEELPEELTKLPDRLYED